MQSEMGPLPGIEQAVAAAVALFTQRLEAPIAVALEVIPRRVGVNEQGLGDLLCHPSTPKQHHRLKHSGYLKGKSAIQIARLFRGKERNFTGENFWARGYFVSTVGLDEATVRAYIRNQEEDDAKYDQMKLGV